MPLIREYKYLDIEFSNDLILNECGYTTFSDMSNIDFLGKYNALPKFVHLKSNSLNLKIFSHDDTLFTEFGYSHYSVLQKPKELEILCFKKSIRLISEVPTTPGNYAASVLNLKKFSVYKTKGLY